MKNITLLLVLLGLTGCMNESGETDNGDDETFIHLGNPTDNRTRQVSERYFSNVSDFPNEKGQALSNMNEGVYWQAANSFPVRSEDYFSDDNLAYYIYDSNEERIEIAYLLYKGARIKEKTLGEDLYISWIYNFKEEKLVDFLQENEKGETKDFFSFTDEEWLDYSEGHRDFLLQSLRHLE